MNGKNIWEEARPVFEKALLQCSVVILDHIVMKLKQEVVKANDKIPCARSGITANIIAKSAVTDCTMHSMSQTVSNTPEVTCIKGIIRND